MHTLLQYVFSEDVLVKQLREQWMSLFDQEYIDMKVIAGVRKNLPTVNDTLKLVEKRATGTVTVHN